MTATNCTRCESRGFLNLAQVDSETLAAFDQSGDEQVILDWIKSHEAHDVTVCDCCGDGEHWHGTPGEHDHRDYGKDGPYASNGGLPLCH